MKLFFASFGSLLCLLLLGMPGVLGDAVAARSTLESVINARNLPAQALRVGTGVSSEAEAQELLAIDADTNRFQKIPQLEAFLERHPESPWAASLHQGLAHRFHESRQTTKALQHWESSWQALKPHLSEETYELAASILAEWSGQLSSLGRLKELKAVLSDAGKIPVTHPIYRRQLESARYNIYLMEEFPGKSFRCGTLALRSVGLTLHTNRADINRLVEIQSSTQGFSLAELQHLADKFDLGLTSVRRTAGEELVVPSVIHWRQDHYAAILKRDGQSVYVSDPTFRLAQWLHVEVVNEEASGAFLVPSDRVPQGWATIESSSAAQIYGKGLPEDINDGRDKGCPKGKGCNCKGMPVWWVSEPYINLFIADEPLSYLTSRGEEMSFRFTYKQRDTRPIIPHNSNFGDYGEMPTTGWNHNWFSYLRITQASVSPHTFAGAHALVYLPGGGELYFDSTPATDSETGAYLSNCGISTSIVNVMPDDTGLSGYRLAMADGTQYIYGRGVMLNDYGGPFAYDFFLTRVITPNGDTTILNYEGAGTDQYRLKEVIDADGRTNSFGYTGNLVSTVTSPYGKTATIMYSGNAVSSITDSEGNVSSLTYGTNGYPATLVTPYGTNKFYILEQAEANQHEVGGHDFIPRAIAVTDPAGGTDLYLYRFLASFLPTTVPTNEVPVGTPLGTLDDGTVGSGTNTFHYVYFRNSFHWNPRQFDALSTSVIPNLSTATLTDLTTTDYLRAHRSHWLSDANELNVVDLLSFEQAPSPDGSSDGLKTFYDYPGKPYHHQQGSQNMPAVVAWRYPGGQTSYTWTTYSTWGVPTSVVSTYTKTDGTTGTRTNSWVYANNIYTNTVVACSGTLSTTWTVPNLLTTVIGPDGVTNWNLGTFDAVQWSIQLGDSFAHCTNTSTVSARRVIPSAATNAVNDVTRLYFGNFNRIAGIKSPTGSTTTNFYDSGGFLTKSINVEALRTNSFAYGDHGLVILWTNTFGSIQTNRWDSLLRLISAADERGYISNNYSALSLASHRDRLGHWKYFGYDRANRPTAVTNELGQKTLLGWCTCGALESITNAVGEITTFTRDQQSRLTGLTLSSSPAIAYSYGIDLAGRMTNVMDSAGVEYQLAYNNQGLLTNISNSAGRVAGTVYDSRDRPVQVASSGGAVITNTFDLLDRLLKRQLPVGNAESFGYQPAGWIAYTNQIGKVSLQSYNESGLVLNLTNANLEITRFAYDPVGNLTNLLDGNSHVTSWQFDKFGRLTNKLDHTGSTAFRYLYDANDRLTNRWTPAKGNTGYAYDDANRLTGITYPTIPAVAVAFDALGRMTNLVDALGTTRWTYSRLGAVTSEDGPWDAEKVSSTYGTAHRLTQLNVARPNASDWVQTFGYDSVGRLNAIASQAGNFGYTFLNASALVTRLTLGNGSVITNSYDGDLRMTSTWLRNAGGTALNSHGYGYNDAHQRTAATNFFGNRWSYVYDNSGQLTAANGFESGGGLRASEQFGYAYDAGGNLTNRVNYALQQSFAPDALNQLSSASRSGNYTVAGGTVGSPTSVTVNGSAATVLSDGSFVRTNVSLTSGNNTFTAVATDALGRTDTSIVTAWLPSSGSFTYDSNGNLTSDGYRALTYDDENRLTSVTISGVSRSEFVYDGLSRQRIRREYDWVASAWMLLDEVHLVYDGSVVIQERDRFNQPTIAYTRGRDFSGSRQGFGGIGGLLARSDHGTGLHAYYHSDAGGNVAALTDGLQNVVARYAYDSFGGTLQASGPMAVANRYRFSSKEFHPGSGTYDYGFRNYDPAFQRWVNRDPIGERGGINQYGFVNNAPVGSIDPFGLSDTYSSLATEGLCDVPGSGDEGGTAQFSASSKGYRDSNVAFAKNMVDMTPWADAAKLGGVDLYGNHVSTEDQLYAAAGFFPWEKALSLVGKAYKWCRVAVKARMAARELSKLKKARLGLVPAIMGHTKSLRDPEIVSTIKAAMLDGTYRFNDKEGIIAGVVDSTGTIHLTEGQHRMNAALEILEETGDPQYVNRLIDSAKQGIDGRQYITPGMIPIDSAPLPRR
ncbi:MAG TPA: RHS repeat-associated core domain-containing protein [Candidatus Limnocylindria bacterium]|nr:RHS repeat-associated core domain-containing protein [Candidatus Limnocylindria bacterium]